MLNIIKAFLSDCIDAFSYWISCWLKSDGEYYSEYLLSNVIYIVSEGCIVLKMLQYRATALKNIKNFILL